jgi:hypothetical protein
VSSKHIAHGGRREIDAELLQLADDAEIAPARILPRETKYEREDIGIERVRSDLVRTREPPVPADEFTVPAQQRCWCDEKSGPPLTRKKSSECRQYDAIGWGEPRSRYLATEDRELMTKDRDLDVLLVWGRSYSNQVKQLANEQEGH